MFTKLDIKQFGLYKDFTWGTLPEFGRVNIIYGRNYSGKTTLSRIFDGISLGQLHKNYTDGEFTLHTDDNTVKEVNQSNMSDCPYAVRVYNSDYVSRNLSWLRNEEEGEILPFTLLGSDNVEAQKAIEEIDEKLGNIEEKKGLLYVDNVKNKEFGTKKDKYDEALNALEQQLKNKANGDIKRKNIYVKQGTSYIVNNIKKDIEEFVTAENVTVDESGQPLEKPILVYKLEDSVVLSEEEKEQLKKTVGELEKIAISKLPEVEPHLSEYAVSVKELVTRKIALSRTLQDLIENDLLQKWVDEGRKLNKDRQRCAFCGNIIGEKRWEELNAHFSKESEELKSSLQALKEKLEKASQSLDGFLEGKGFTKENIYATLHGEFDSVIVEWNGYVVWYKKEIEGMIGLIDERLGNIFKPIEIARQARNEDEDCGEAVVELTPILKKINSLIEKNNEYGLKLDSAKDAARKKLRLDYVYHFCVDINYAEVMTRLAKEEDELSVMEEAATKRAEEIGGLRKQRKQKELDKKDEGLAAKKVTELLFDHFGNGSLSLEPEQVEDEVDEDTGEVKPRTRFVVKRGGKTARNLSEGEKRLISFCYFIAQMADEVKGPDAGNLVIFIDDPISSLDNSHIFFMHSLIDTVLVKPTCFGQLFISTHNLEFLKFTKRFKMRGASGTKKICHYVAVKLGKGTTTESRCEIREMPKYLRKYMTEYNFLFEQIYEIAKLNSKEEQTLYGEQYTLYYNIGNNMRKFLECYLFNRYPDTDDPLSEHLIDLFDDHIPSEVNRVVNEYSHLVWAERGMKVMDVPEVVTAAREILNALKTKDNAHYVTLCKSVDADENVNFTLTA